jgi:uncharacterized protein (TIGR03083 family)
MVPDPDHLPQLLAAIEGRSAQIVLALSGLGPEALSAPSELPGWSRLTIACHLRYGAEALCRMTDATVSGQPAAYYPEGRARQRLGTLVPNDGEGPLEVVASLAHHAGRLRRAWSSLGGAAWDRQVIEPTDNPDLGPIALAALPLLRLTEVEIHGSDLALGLDDWSALFIRHALPMRLNWLNIRRVNHREFDQSLEGDWLLVATDGPAFRISVSRTNVTAEPADRSTPARAVIEATSRDLLALLFGRPFVRSPVITGDAAFGEVFADAFPGP